MSERIIADEEIYWHKQFNGEVLDQETIDQLKEILSGETDTA